MLGSIFSHMTLFGQSRASLDSALANTLSVIGKMDSDGRPPTQRSNDTLPYGGQGRKSIRKVAFLILPMLRGIAWFCWRIHFVESGLTIDLLEMNLSSQWRR